MKRNSDAGNEVQLILKEPAPNKFPQQDRPAACADSPETRASTNSCRKLSTHLSKLSIKISTSLSMSMHNSARSKSLLVQRDFNSGPGTPFYINFNRCFLLQQLIWLPIEKRIEEKCWHLHPRPTTTARPVVLAIIWLQYLGSATFYIKYDSRLILLCNRNYGVEFSATFSSCGRSGLYSCHSRLCSALILRCYLLVTHFDGLFIWFLFASVLQRHPPCGVTQQVHTISMYEQKPRIY